MSKTVLVYTTTGQGNNKTFESVSETFGDLKRELSANGITHDNMKAVVGESRVTLESDLAQLPTTNFTLFLMPKKTKAGVTATEIDKMDFKQLREEMKKIFAENPSAKSHFIDGSKNWTQLSLDKIKELLKSWIGKSPKSSKEVAKETEKQSVKEAVGEVVDSLKKAKETEEAEEKTVKDVIKETKKSSDEEIITLFHLTSDVKPSELTSDEVDQFNTIVELLNKLTVAILERKAKEAAELEEKKRKDAELKAAAENKAKEAKEKEEFAKKQKDDLRNQAKELAKEFKDVANF